MTPPSEICKILDLIFILDLAVVYKIIHFAQTVNSFFSVSSRDYFGPHLEGTIVSLDIRAALF